jgi:hypothetical protein
MSDTVPSTGNADYDALPEPIKRTYTLLEYLWLSDWEKTNLIHVESEPEVTEP